jgi:hypothetical protein
MIATNNFIYKYDNIVVSLEEFNRLVLLNKSVVFVDKDSVFSFSPKIENEQGYRNLGGLLAETLKKIIADEFETPEKEIKPEENMTKLIETDVEKEYYEELTTGMFFVWYPHLTGSWERDKNEYLDIYKNIIKMREAQNYPKGFSTRHKSTNGETHSNCTTHTGGRNRK